MSTSAHIRPATSHDIEAIAQLLSELNREEGYDTSASSEAMRVALSDDRVTMCALVAEMEKRICGLALYYWGYDTVSASYGFHLADIIVAQAERRHGIGKRLFARLAEQCLQEGGQWISLTVLKKNEAAQKFYASCGMSEVAVNFFAIGPQALRQVAAK